jgi:hypothetical protein
MPSSSRSQVRDIIHSSMHGMPVPSSTPDETLERREDGVVEFNRHWCVRGNDQQGVFASFCDQDDVIEFGLLERDGEMAVNLLHVTVVLDDDASEMNCMSESNTDFNFETQVTPEKQGRLNEALRFFADGLRGATV